jgi:hypothetical protein
MQMWENIKGTGGQDGRRKARRAVLLSINISVAS